MWLNVMLVSLFGFSSILSAELGGIAVAPLGRALGEGELDTDGVCSTLGMACQNCTFAVTCIPLSVRWLKVPLQHCPEGQTCNAHLQKCSEETVPECDTANAEYHHTCEQLGIFPDAYDCHKFHLCSPPEGMPNGRPAVALCPRYYGYDTNQGQCSINLENGTCTTRPVPNCTEVGQTGPLDNSYRHYYVCLLKHGNLYPQIFVCPNGRDFWDCDPNLVVKTTETTEASSTTEIITNINVLIISTTTE